MQFVFMIVGFLVLVALLIFAAWRSYQRNKQRVAALSAYAAAHGLNFAETDPELCSRWDGAPFDLGHDRRAYNVLTGSYRQRDVAVFDYQYEETSTDSDGSSDTTTYRFSIYAIALSCALPRLSVTPEGLLSKLGHVIGVHDIQLESEQFNKAFRVTSDDKRLAYDLLPARTMELLMSQPDVHLRTDGAWLLCVDSGVLQPPRLERRLELMGSLLDNVPSFVWDDRSTADGAS